MKETVKIEVNERKRFRNEETERSRVQGKKEERK